MRRTSVCESKRCTADVNGHFCRFAAAFAFAYDRSSTSFRDIDPVDGPVLRSAHSDLDLDFDHDLGPELNLDHDVDHDLKPELNLELDRIWTSTRTRIPTPIWNRLRTGIQTTRIQIRTPGASRVYSIDRCKQDASWKKMSGKYFFLVANCNLP